MINSSIQTFFETFQGLEGANTLSGPFADKWQIYFNGNERNAFYTLNVLKKLPAKGDTLIGVSGFFNLALYLARKERGVRYVVSIDPAPCYATFWQLVKRAFSEATSRREFQAALQPQLTAQKEALFSREKIAMLTQLHGKRIFQLENDFSFLFENLIQTEEQYQELKALFYDERFVHFPIDLGAQPAITQVFTKYLKEHSHTLDTLYVSNVRECLALHEQNFDQNVVLLSEDHPHLVDSFGLREKGKKLKLYQRVNGASSKPPILKRLGNFLSGRL